MKEIVLNILKHHLIICRLHPEDMLPGWAMEADFYSLTRTKDELSIITVEKPVPENVPVEKGWRCFEVSGPLDFSLTGILSSISSPLSQAGISIFAISTFNTDYILVKSENLDKAITVLRGNGFIIHEAV